MKSRSWRKLVIVAAALIPLAAAAIWPLVARAQAIGGSPDLTSLIIDGIQKAGALGAIVLFFMWREMKARWMEEREERLNFSKERTGYLERVLEALNNASISVSQSSETGKQAVSSVEQLAQLIREALARMGSR